MKKVLIAGIAAAAFLSVPALAGPPPPPAPMFNWSGFYIGVNGGGMEYKSSGHFENPCCNWGTNREDAALAGVHAGFQGQWGNFVLGVEGGWQANLSEGFSSRVGDNVVPGVCGLNVILTCQTRVDDILYFGPRIGIAMGQWLLYGTGGYARANVETRLLVNDGSVVEPTSQHHNGWYYGGGLDFLVMKNLAFGVEYRHYDFSSAHQMCANCTADNRDVKVKADAALLRLTIKGGG